MTPKVSLTASFTYEIFNFQTPSSWKEDHFKLQLHAVLTCHDGNMHKKFGLCRSTGSPGNRGLQHGFKKHAFLRQRKNVGTILESQ